MPIELTERFQEAYLRLPIQIQRKVDKALELLDEDRRHPGLQTKLIKGTLGIYEARVDQKYRMTYEINRDTYVMRNVGSHDPTLKSP